jgi:SAM-dependent methyltransferase
MSARIDSCRACGSGDLALILALGSMPLANALLTSDDLGGPEASYPLEVAFCRSCSLVQINETVPPEALFRNYLYFSSFSDTVLANARDIVDALMASRTLEPNSLVVEIASNDGYLLKHFVAAGVPVLGIEPARNIAAVATAKGVRTIAEFFSAELAEDLVRAGERADVILANNVMAHVPDINGVVTGIRTLLKPDGVFVMETPYLKDLIDHLEFDTIYHEHLFYYSMTALERLLQQNGLAAADVQRVPIHGGSLRVSIVHAGREGERPRVQALLAEEQGWGVDDLAFYEGFAARVTGLRTRLCALLNTLKKDGKRLAGYGAAAKGSTLLNFMGIGEQLLDFVVDRSTYKQGRFMPGVRLPIHPPDTLLQAMPDYVLLLTWNFANEILAQQREFLDRGGRFIVPVPEPTVVGR